MNKFHKYFYNLALKIIFPNNYTSGLDIKIERKMFSNFPSKGIAYPQ
jgi:hypothetical protein